MISDKVNNEAPGIPPTFDGINELVVPIPISKIVGLRVLKTFGVNDNRALTCLNRIFQRLFILY